MDLDLFGMAFFHARLKINRANRHIDEAQHWFRIYVEGDFYQLIDDRNPETGHQSIRLAVAPVPAELVLAIGDAFHCLSSALDYVMSGLMLAKTGDAARVHFPIDESRKSLRHSFMKPRPGKTPPPRRRIVEAFPAIAFELLSVIKPYKGGDFALWEIRKADNIDKHNLIIPSIAVTEIKGIRLEDKVRRNVFENVSLAVGAGGVLNAIGYGGGSHLEFTNKGQATASISFPDGMEVFAGKPVFPTLLECSQFVTQTIDRIEVIAKRYL